MQNPAVRCKDFFGESTSSHHKGEKDDREQGDKSERAPAAAAAAAASSPSAHERVNAVVCERALRRGPAAITVEVEGVSRHV